MAPRQPVALIQVSMRSTKGNHKTTKHNAKKNGEKNVLCMAPRQPVALIQVSMRSTKGNHKTTKQNAKKNGRKKTYREWRQGSQLPSFR